MGGDNIKLDVAYDKQYFGFRENIPKGDSSRVSQFVESMSPGKNGMDGIMNIIDYFNVLKKTFEEAERGTIKAFHYNKSSDTVGAEGFFQVVSSPEKLNPNEKGFEGTMKYVCDKIGKEVGIYDLNKDGTYEGTIYNEVLKDDITKKFPNLKEAKIEFYTDNKNRNHVGIEATYTPLIPKMNVVTE